KLGKLAKRVDWSRCDEFRHFLETTEATYAQTARISYDLRRKGLTIPLSDLIITAHCLSNNLTLLTRDNHFQMIKQQMPLLMEDFQ
ncbi:hypothetical protein JXQ70_11995, partial [bacterium]|nr:hypothetical protein [bacterium]